MRSGKTQAIWQDDIIEVAENANIVSRHYRRHQVTAKKSLKDLFFKIMRTQFPELWNIECWNQQEGIYTMPTNYPNNGIITFNGTDDINKLEGEEQDRAHINELMEHSKRAVMAILGRTRGVKTFDWNPSASDHWAFDYFFKQDPSEYIFLQSTYKDNPFLTEDQVNEIEKWEPTEKNIRAGTADKWYWEVYGLGKPAKRPGVIYENWDVCDFWPERHAMERWGYGLDFGWIDPTALVECGLHNGDVYARELIYDDELVVSGTLNDPDIKSLVGMLDDLEIDKAATIIADSAQRTIIEELRVHGYNVIGVKKSKSVTGKNFINAGIDRLNQYRKYVTRNSTNLQTELRNYTRKYDIQKDKFLDDPVDDFNHALDAWRYWAWHFLVKFSPRSKIITKEEYIVSEIADRRRKAELTRSRPTQRFRTLFNR